MSEYAKLVKLIKIAAQEAVEAKKPTGILFGIVTSTAPLTIFVDAKTTLIERELLLLEQVTDYQTELSFDDPAVKQVFTTWNMSETEESSQSKISFKKKIRHKVTIYNGLQAGDKVALLQIQGGQRFLVLDRVVKQ